MLGRRETVPTGGYAATGRIPRKRAQVASRASGERSGIAPKSNPYEIPGAARLSGWLRESAGMNNRFFVVVVALSACSFSGAQPPPLEAFAALPAMQSPTLSPDGQRIAFITHVDRGSFVYASRLASQQADAVV